MGIMDVHVRDERVQKIRRFSGKQPLNTACYCVELGETVASVAAKFEITPSKLTRLNKLPVGLAFLHPGQILYVPCNNTEADTSMLFITSKASSNELTDLTRQNSTESSASTLASSEFNDELGKSVTEPQIPTQTVHSTYEQNGHKAKVKEYLRVHSKLITDLQGVIDGSLLATPNVLRFDPHVSDPLVLEQGTQSFCVEAQIDKVISLAIYWDLRARDNLERIRNGSFLEVPEIYHPCEVHECADDSSLTECRQIRFALDVAGDTTDDQDHEETGTCTPAQEFTDSIDIPKQPMGKQRHNASSSSCYSVHLSPTVQVFINYNCGIFRQPSLSSVASVGKTLQGVGYELNGSIMYARAGPTGIEDTADGTIQLHSAVAIDEKPELFRTVSELIPKKLAFDCHHYDDLEQPHYLQLILDTTSKQTNTSCQQLQYTEYWLTVPQSRVDEVFNFFTRYHPSLYGNADEDLAVKPTRFVALTPLDRDNSILQSPSVHCLLSNHRINKEWEIVSIDEIMRRKSLLDIEKYLPLPTLTGNSVILTETIITNLTKSLPARAEGFPWTLVFGTEQNGFSLTALYRYMRMVESPVLLIVQDTDENVFGAYLSEPPIRHGTYFGTGECFLFSCSEGYKLFGWTGKNNFHICTMNSGLEIGAGSGNFGLWFDADLYHGRSQKCETYDNEPLTCGSEDFIIANLEVWCFMVPDDCDFITGTLDL